MKRFFILSIMAINIMIQFNCSYGDTSMGEVPLDIYWIDGFGNVKVNESDYQFVSISCDQASGARNWYHGTNLKVIISDNINFTIDTSMTDSFVGETDETSFKICFNPGSAGNFTATVSIITDTRKYKHNIYGRGI